MDFSVFIQNYTWLELNLGGGGSGGSGGRRGKSSASVYPIPHWVWPSGVDRTMQRQRDRARVRTDTRPVMTTGVSIIFIVCMQNLILERPIPRGGADQQTSERGERTGDRVSGQLPGTSLHACIVLARLTQHTPNS